jgi:transposase
MRLALWMGCGRECMTTYVPVIRVVAVASPEKQKALRAHGAFNATPEEVIAAPFVDHPEFFDAEDRLQVRYEMLRAPAQGEMTVAEACRAFGVSRQTFYVLRRAFGTKGLAGLAEGKRGRKGPLKASVEVVGFVRQTKADEPAVSGAELSRRVAERFGIRLHRRTVERLWVPKSGPAQDRARPS